MHARNSFIRLARVNDVPYLVCFRISCNLKEKSFQVGYIVPVLCMLYLGYHNSVHAEQSNDTSYTKTSLKSIRVCKGLQYISAAFR
jgi:hypothetical protein